MFKKAVARIALFSLASSLAAGCGKAPHVKALRFCSSSEDSFGKRYMAAVGQIDGSSFYFVGKTYGKLGKRNKSDKKLGVEISLDLEHPYPSFEAARNDERAWCRTNQDQEGQYKL